MLLRVLYRKTREFAECPLILPSSAQFDTNCHSPPKKARCHLRQKSKAHVRYLENQLEGCQLLDGYIRKPLIQISMKGVFFVLKHVFDSRLSQRVESSGCYISISTQYYIKAQHNNTN